LVRKKREKRKPSPQFLAAVGVVHVTAATLTWRDIGKRADDQIRGNKLIWRIASALNTSGSAAYWLFGRKSAA